MGLLWLGWLCAHPGPAPWHCPGPALVAFLASARVPTLQRGRAVASALGAELRGPRGAGAQPPLSLPGSQVSAASAAAATAQSRGLGGRQRGGLSRSPPGTRVLTAATAGARRPDFLLLPQTMSFTLQEPGSPPSAGVPYCDLPRRPPASEDPPRPSTSGCQSVAGPGLGPGPERGRSAGSSAEAPTAAPGHRSQEPEAVPYLGGLASSLGGSFDEGPESGTSSSPDCNTPDDTSDSSSVDWDTVERREEASSRDELTTMIPRKPQEGSRADSARRAPSLLTRSPVGGDTAGQRKEDTSGSRSAGQHWAKLRGESGNFLERHRLALTPASCATLQGGPRSATPQTSSLRCSAQRDVAQTASTQFDTPRASSPTQIAQRDKPRTSSTQQDIPRTSLTQHNTPRASSPSRIAQQDNPRTSFVQRNSPQVSSPTRATRQDNSRTSSIQQDNPQTSFPTCIPQRDNPRASSPNRTIHRSNPRTSCAQLDNPRAPSPNREV
ncbi:TRIO and F-actin-binding protein-like [Leptonychotes weddellii]|uniref:TRIO and F-actin-binding protein-like n=1 Tax=Leptonychotes weddellii TaxID=9713 RepID=A0A7F8RFD5_LEPWE|nr:TRIO and F-actin-binding protein-like [Leptonychotes weddellii]